MITILPVTVDKSIFAWALLIFRTDRWTQLSQVLRCIAIAENENWNIEILQIASSLDYTGTQFSPALEKTFERIHSSKLDFVKVCGQNYGGASRMSGVYTGETRIRSRQSKDSYVHCASHNLNPVPNNTMTAIQQVMDYFSMAEVYTISIMEMLRDEKQSHYIRLAWKLASETKCHKMDITVAIANCPLPLDMAKSLL